VDPNEAGGFDALGRGVEEGKPVASASKYVSKGLTRSRSDKLVVMSGGAAPEAREQADARAPAPLAGESARSAPGESARGASNVTAFGGAAQTATALREDAQPKLSPTERLEQLAWSEPRGRTEARAAAQADARALAAEKRAEARAKGYDGEACGECGNFTLVRNGTCLKCDTCGGTTGCS
jgi:ribonucleoside-diphosphate reductase alpha chain